MWCGGGGEGEWVGKHPVIPSNKQYPQLAPATQLCVTNQHKQKTDGLEIKTDIWAPTVPLHTQLFIILLLIIFNYQVWFKPSQCLVAGGGTGPAAHKSLCYFHPTQTNILAWNSAVGWCGGFLCHSLGSPNI